MSAFTLTNKVPVVVNVHPPVIFSAIGPLAGKRAGGGAWRGVRATLTGPTSYDTGGSALPALPGFTRVEALLVVSGDDATLNADGNEPRLITATEKTGKIQVFTNANAQVAGATNLSASSWEVLILGR
jgi:hypothetical protein